MRLCISQPLGPRAMRDANAIAPWLLSISHDPFPKTGTHFSGIAPLPLRTILFRKTGTHFSGIVPLPLRTILSRKPVPTFRGSCVETLAEKFRGNVQPNTQILGVEFAPAQVRDGVMRSFTKCGPERPRFLRLPCRRQEPERES